MTLGKRIKKLRKELSLTQQEFADRMQTSKNNIARYEIDKVNPSAAVLTFICREFNVREEWLREGEGEMFLAADEGLITQLAAEYSLDEKSRVLVANFLKLSDYERSVIVQASEIMAKKFAAAPQKSSEATGDAVEKQREEKPEGISEKEWAVILQMREQEELEKTMRTSTVSRSIA